MSSDLQLRSLPCDPCDVDSQKCHVSRTLFKSLDLKLGGSILVSQNSSQFVCSAWILDCDKDAIDFDRCVSSKVALHSQHSAHHITAVTPVKTGYFSDVEVALILQKPTKIAQHRAENIVKDYLKDMMFGCGFFVQKRTCSKHVFAVEVLQVKHRSGLLFGSLISEALGKSTTIAVRQVVSKRRFLQTREKPALCGLQLQQQQVRDLFRVAFRPDVSDRSHLPISALVSGPSGCGKTTLIRAVAISFRISLKKRTQQRFPTVSSCCH